jgi:hypothetical protein
MRACACCKLTLATGRARLHHECVRLTHAHGDRLVNTSDPDLRGKRALQILSEFALLALRALARTLRVVLFAILAPFAPLVHLVFGLGSLVGFLTTALFYFTGPPSPEVSYGTLLALSAGFAVIAVLYERLLRVLEP